MNQKTVEVIARAIIVRQGKILLCRPAREKWYFFPGGHVEYLEKADDSLKREVEEELGAKARKLKLVGLIQNIYGSAKSRRHELNLFYRADIKADRLTSKESHIEFEWIPLKSLGVAKVLPDAAKSSVVLWLKNRRFFTNL